MLALYRAGRQSEALEAYRAGARRRSSSRSASSPAPSCSGCTSRSSPTTRRSTCPPAAEPEPATRQAAPSRPGARARCWSAPPCSLLAGVTAFGIIRVLEPDSLAGIDEDAVGLIDPDGGRITAQYAVGRGPAR